MPARCLNGTTRNGSGGGETVDDGKTFRGYGDGDWLALHLKQPCDLSEIRTFAGHNDARASQRYTVLVAYAAEPERFVKLATGSKRIERRGNRVDVAGEGQGRRGGPFRVPERAAGVQRSYREINIIGQAAK